jgi:hypothetical protein
MDNTPWLHRAIEVPAEEPPFHPVLELDTVVDEPAVEAVTQPMSITSLENSVLRGIDVAEAVTQPPSVYDYGRMAVVLIATYLRRRRDG